MLILTRRPGERIVIDHTTEMVVFNISGEKVRLGFVAPASVRIMRGELINANVTSQREADDEKSK